jgi:hypothetical protein
MKITGHRTVSVFQRYAIVAERDIADLMKKVESFHQAARKGNSCTVDAQSENKPVHEKQKGLPS